MGNYAIGVDLGGTNTRIGIVDDAGKLYQYEQILTYKEQGVHDIIMHIVQTIKSLISNFHGSIVGLGIGVAGQVDSNAGNVIFAPNLGWHDVPIRQMMEKELNLSVFVTNDMRAIAFGEWLYGAGNGCNNLVCLFVGTGIGCGVISDGRLLSGHNNTFGEVGHMSVNFDGPICVCGNQGCLEAFAGGLGMANRARNALMQLQVQSNVNRQMILQLSEGDANKISAKIIAQAAVEGDIIAGRIVFEAQQAFIAGCVNLVNIFNPQMLILGGGVLNGFPEWIEKLDRKIHQYALQAATRSLKIIKTTLGKHIGIIGAAAMVLYLSKTQESASE